MSDFTILVLDGALDTSVGATLDLLCAARTLSARAKTPAPRWRLVSPDGGDVKLKSGLVAQTQKLGPHRQADPSLWIVPGIGLESESAVMALPSQRGAQAAMGALSSHQARGGRMAISCSSVFLPAFAGLLSGRQVTTCWWLAPLMQRHFPDIKVDAARMVVADGNLVTAGAAFAQIDLMLHVLRSEYGPKLADLVARHMLIDAREAQAAYVIPEVLASGDALVGRIIARAEKALPDIPSVAALASAFGISERTLSRHVRRATGKSTKALLQSVRLRKARHLLAQSRMPVEDIAAQVGYGDATALRRLMRKVTGASPRQFRPGP